MDTLARILFITGAIPLVLGIVILVILAPRPRTIWDHLQGVARYLMLGGAVFFTVRILNGQTPPWDAVCFMLGIGLGMALYARQNHLLAMADEHLTEGERSGT